MDESEASPGHDRRGWERAAAGLSIYGSALYVRLAAIVIGYALLMLAYSSRSSDTVKLLWGLPFVVAITGFVMTIGLLKFAWQPANSPGKILALLGAVSMLIATALDIYALKRVNEIFDSYRTISGPGALDEGLEIAFSTGAWGGGVALLALVFALASMRLVTNQPEWQRVKGVAPAAAFLVCAAAVAAFLCYGLPREGFFDFMVKAGVALALVCAAARYGIVLVRRAEASILLRTSAASSPSASVGDNEQNGSNAIQDTRFKAIRKPSSINPVAIAITLLIVGSVIGAAWVCSSSDRERSHNQRLQDTYSAKQAGNSIRPPAHSRR